MRYHGKDRLAVDIDGDQLKSAPTFDSNRWPDWNDSAYRAGIAERYGASTGQANARFRRASDVMKAKVRDAHGGNIGDVEDMIVDLREGRVQQVVVKFDRAWRANHKLVALPMSSFADGASAERSAPKTAAAAPPLNTSPPLALLNPSNEPSKGMASAVNPPGSVETRPPAVDARANDVKRLEREPLRTTTSYADDENLVFKGTREQVSNAPAFDAKRYPD